MGSGTPLSELIAAVAQVGRRFPLVLYAAAASQMLPLLAAFRHRTRLPAARLWALAWCAMMLISDAVQIWLRGDAGNNNRWSQMLAIPIQNAIMLWTLSLWQRQPVSRLAFRIAIPLFLVAMIAVVPALRDHGLFDTVARPFQALLLLAAALHTLIANAARDPGGVTRQDWFWITLGASLYFGLRVALPPFAAALMQSNMELVRLAYLVQAWADIAVFLLIARGIWCPLPQARSGGFF